MSRTIRALAALVALGLLLVHAGPSLLAQASPILDISMTTAGSPSYGFPDANPITGATGQAVNEGEYYTFTNVPGGGPNGLFDAAQIDMTPVDPPVVAGVTNPCTDKASCENYIGWAKSDLQVGNYPDDQDLYIHFWHKKGTWVDPREAIDNGGLENTSKAGGKFIGIGDSADTVNGFDEPTNQRVFINQNSATAGTNNSEFHVSKNIDGAPTDFTYNIPDSNWHAYVLWIDTSSVARLGTAQGCTASTITLDTGASAVDNAYSTFLVITSGGTARGQYRTISSYVGATKVATLSSNWASNCDATTTFRLLAADARLKWYVDGNITTSTVTQQSSGTFALSPDRFDGTFAVGFFVSWIHTGGSLGWSISRVLVDDVLDTTFYTDMAGGGGGSGPYRMRFKTALASPGLLWSWGN